MLLGIPPDVMRTQTRMCVEFLVAGYHVVRHPPNPYERYKSSDWLTNQYTNRVLH